ncbi:MAG: YihY family inner membrane protein [Porticoccaceae bacterium]
MPLPWKTFTGEQARKTLLMWGAFLKYVMVRYNSDGCRESAAALTYMSLFAVVPLLTVVYSVFSMVPAFQGLGSQVQELIFRNFLPETGAEIQDYLLEFSTQARKLSVVGALILIVTAYLMLANIEKNFNRIWGTLDNRKGLSGFLLYWGILSFGPLLVGIGLVMHTYLVSLQLMMNEVDALGVTTLLFRYLPWLLTWMAFTLLFVAVPNCKVVFRYALAGGLVSTVLFEVAKSLFGSFVANSSYHSMYGAFAILPVFLLWIYLCWMITLAGAELVRSLETFGSVFRGRRLPNLVAAVLVCWECWRRQQMGRSLSDRDIIRSWFDQQHWLELRRLLLEHRILEVTRNNHYVLVRDIGQLTLWQLAAVFGDNFTRAPASRSASQLGEYPWFAGLDSLLHTSAAQSEALLSMPLAHLFQENEQREALPQNPQRDPP